MDRVEASGDDEVHHDGYLKSGLDFGARKKLQLIGALRVGDVLANAKVIGEPIDEAKLFACKWTDRSEANKSWHGLLNMGGQSKTGVGRFIDYENRTIFEGQMLHGKPHGFGRRIFNNGTYYLGYFKRGQVDGFGSLMNKRDIPEEQGYWRKGVLQHTEGVQGQDHAGHRHHTKEF